MTWGKPKGKRGSGWGWGGGGDDPGPSIVHRVMGGISEVVAGGVLRAKKETYADTAAGWWLGVDDDGQAKIHFGDTVYSLKWTGAALEIVGSIGGSITDLVIAATGAIRSGKANYSDTTAGFWLGKDGGVSKFHIGDINQWLRWNSYALDVKGAIGGTLNELVIATGGLLRSGKSVYDDSGAGFWMGNDGGVTKFNIGGAQEWVNWNGTLLDIAGQIGGNITDLVMAAGNSAISSGKTSYTSTTAGFWLGVVSNVPKFNIGDASHSLKWTGAALDIVGNIGGSITALVLSATNSSIRAGKTSFSDTTAGFWLGLDTTTPKFIIGNATNYLSWAGSVLLLVGSISGKITDLQLSDNGVQLRAGKTSFSDTTAGFWLGVSSGGYPQFHIGNATTWWKFDASASPAVTYQWDINASDIDFSSGIDVEAVEAAVPYTAARFRWLDGGGNELGFLEGFYDSSDNKNVHIHVGTPTADGAAVGSASWSVNLRGDNSLPRGWDISGCGIVGVSTPGTTGFNTFYLDDIQALNAAELYIELGEISAPAAPASDLARLYCRDNGSGKTQICVRFPTGAVQVLATEP